MNEDCRTDLAKAIEELRKEAEHVFANFGPGAFSLTPTNIEIELAVTRLPGESGPGKGRWVLSGAPSETQHKVKIMLTRPRPFSDLLSNVLEGRGTNVARSDTTVAIGRSITESAIVSNDTTSGMVRSGDYKPPKPSES
jgi:hypothetical protein